MLSTLLDNKNVQGSQIFCTYFVVTCSALALSNGMISSDEDPRDDGRYPVNTIATFTCNDEFYLDGDVSATCESSGSWSHESICRGNEV